jgi:uncharacterized DUF497 family protein
LLTKCTHCDNFYAMKIHYWDIDKNNLLKFERGISFEDVMFYIEQQKLLAIIKHPNQNKYPGQKLYVIEINNYVYIVPFVETDNEIFLKTIIPSHKATKNYLEE